jgi:integrase
VQKGRIYRHGNQWMLRYRIPVEVGGRKRWKDCYQKLAEISDSYGSVRSVEHLAKPYLYRANGQITTTATTQAVANFIEHRYFVHVDQEKVLAPSTIFGYKHIFEKHLKDRLEDTRLCDFTTATGRKLLVRIAQEARLSRSSLKHIKWFLAAVFKYAKNEDAFKDTNPMPDVELPRGADGAETHAYSLEEIISMLEALSEEPTAVAVVATAAFTGLRRSELRGLRWEDLRDNQLFISRTVWNTHQREKTKTAESKAPVPIVSVLNEYLEAHRNGFPADGFIFAGPKMSRPLNLANLARRVIVPKLSAKGVEWHGWHAFRRGLATNLYCLGVPETTIQAIMRHADLETTRQHYIKRLMVPETSTVAMRKVEKLFTRMRRSGRKRAKGAAVLGTKVGTNRKAHKVTKSLRHA